MVSLTLLCLIVSLKTVLGRLWLVKYNSVYVELKLTTKLTDKTLEDWLRQNQLLKDYYQIDFSEASSQDLEYLPMLFYKDYTNRNQLLQISKVLRQLTTLSPYLEKVKKTISFVVPSGRNPIIYPNGVVPWRGDRSSSEDEIDTTSSSQDEGQTVPSHSETSLSDDDTLMFSLDFK